MITYKAIFHSACFMQLEDGSIMYIPAPGFVDYQAYKGQYVFCILNKGKIVRVMPVNDAEGR